MPLPAHEPTDKTRELVAGFFCVRIGYNPDVPGNHLRCK